ncbi:MAG: hypothetical protein ABI563_00245 [Specibacter sp.]
MEALILAGTVGVVASAATYFLLRLFLWNKAAAKSLEHIRKHAVWTGIIAWALSSLAGAALAGIYDPDQVQNNPWATVPWIALIAPVVAVVGVHTIGQVSWPAPKSAKRVAVLEYRRVRDYVQPALGCAVLGIFAVTAAALPFVFLAPGFMSANGVVLGDAGQSLVTRHGRVPGYVLATALTLALGLLVAGTLLVMRLIASRRSLADLSYEQNTTLRAIGMNRLLRVSATVASGLASIAGNYLSQPRPDLAVTSWVNWLGILNALVLIAMLLWKPPFLDAPTDDAGYNTLFGFKTAARLDSDDGPSAAKLTDAAVAAVLPGGIVGAALGYALRHWFGTVGIVGMSALFILLTYTAVEFLLRRNYATPGTPRTKLGVWLPWPLYISFVVAAVGLSLALVHAHGVGASGGRNTWDGLHTPEAGYLVPGILALVILAAGLASMRFVLVRPGLGNAPPSLDRTLRRRSLLRMARTVTGCWYAILGTVLIMVPVAPAPNPLAPRFESGIFGAGCLVIAALVVFHPMRGFGPADFTPRAAVSSPGGSSVGK